MLFMTDVVSVSKDAHIFKIGKSLKECMVYTLFFN
jgi:hypothetical protein